MLYLIHIATEICIFLVIAWSFQLAVGYTGIMNLSHVAFVGIGAYAASIATLSYGWPFPFALALAMIAPIPFAWLLSRLSKNVRGDYLALMTLWFLFVVYVVELNWQSLTRGPLGLVSITPPALLHSPLRYLIFVIIIVLVCWALLKRLVDSPYHRVLSAVRDDEVIATVLGKDVVAAKRSVMVFTSSLAGLAGACFAFFVSFIDPSSFYLPMLILVMTMVIAGGLGSLTATTVGVVVFSLLPEALRFFPLPAEYLGALRQILYAGILLGILIVRPQGMFGKVELPSA